MSSRYEQETVFAVDSLGKRYRIYDRYHYAGGCEYKDEIVVKDARYRICGYPLEDKVEETGEKLPSLKLWDLQSYFTETPTQQIREILEKAKAARPSFTQLVMLIRHSGIDGTECICVTGAGTSTRRIFERSI